LGLPVFSRDIPPPKFSFVAGKMEDEGHRDLVKEQGEGDFWPFVVRVRVS